MFRGNQALPTPKNRTVHPYARRIRRHTWQAAGLVVVAFLAGLVWGALLL